MVKNNLPKQIYKLFRKARKGDLENSLLIEGQKLFKLARSKNLELKLVVTLDSDREIYKGCKVYHVNKETFKRLSATKSPQYPLALIKFTPYTIKDIKHKSGVYLYCYKIQDPGNFGTIIRTSLATGVDAIFSSPETSSIYNPKVLRASAGAIFDIAVIQNIPLDKMFSFTRERNIPVVTLDPHKGKSIDNVTITSPYMLVVGNESKGVPEELIKKSNLIVTIPVKGVESLNVSVATAVALYKLQIWK